MLHLFGEPKAIWNILTMKAELHVQIVIDIIIDDQWTVFNRPSINRLVDHFLCSLARTLHQMPFRGPLRETGFPNHIGRSSSMTNRRAR